MSRQNRFRLLSCIAAFLLVLGLSAVTAGAIGVTPGRKTVDFAPDLHERARFTILNNEHKKFNALVYAEGYMSGYVDIGEEIVVFEESDNSKEVEYSIDLPSEMKDPGDHWAKIVVMEMPPGLEEEDIEGEVVIATTAVIHQLRVKVPYPGKFARLDLSVNEGEPGEETTFFVKVSNLGEEDIHKAYATIDILGPTNEVIATLESEEINVDSRERGEIIIPWKANVEAGRYHAVATVNYDGEVGVVEKNFAVGALKIDVLKIEVNNFRLGGVAKFEISVENKWNQRIDDVYAEMIINDDKGNRIASFKSASVDVEPLKRSSLYSYWDTEGVDKGKYEGRLLLHYAGKTTEKTLKTYITIDDIETEIVGVTARAITRSGAAAGPGADLLVPLVVILVFINLGWFLYFRRRK